MDPDYRMDRGMVNAKPNSNRLAMRIFKIGEADFQNFSCLLQNICTRRTKNAQVYSFIDHQASS